MSDMYNANLDRNDANFTPLSPLSFLKRTEVKLLEKMVTSIS